MVSSHTSTKTSDMRRNLRYLRNPRRRNAAHAHVPGEVRVKEVAADTETGTMEAEVTTEARVKDTEVEIGTEIMTTADHANALRLLVKVKERAVITEREVRFHLCVSGHYHTYILSI